MELPNKNIGYISLFKDIDFLDTISDAIRFHFSYLALLVCDGLKTVNELSNGKKNILEKMIEAAGTRIRMLAWVRIAGGDVQKEFNKLVNRIGPYVGRGVHGLVIEVTDGWSMRKAAEAVKYVGLVRSKWPGLPIILLDTTTGSVNMATWVSLVDQLQVLCTWSDDPIDAIRDEYMRYLGMPMFAGLAVDDAMKVLDKIFVPVLGICNLPAHRYLFKGLKVLRAYAYVLASKFRGCGLIDWNPKGSKGLGDDQSAIDQTVVQMEWAGQAPLDPPKSEDLEGGDGEGESPTPETPLTRDQKIDRLLAWAKGQGIL